MNLMLSLKCLVLGEEKKREVTSLYFTQHKMARKICLRFLEKVSESHSFKTLVILFGVSAASVLESGAWGGLPVSGIFRVSLQGISEPHSCH